MFSKEEQQFIEMARKFRDELDEVDKMMEELELRRRELLWVLYGEKVDVAIEGAFADESPMPIEEPVEEEIEPVKSTVTTPSAREALDKRVMRAVEKNDGLTRREIIEKTGMGGNFSYTATDISNSLKRLRMAGSIDSAGHGKASTWHVVEGEK
jgi:predicted HTH transcriptional regulator